MKILGGMLPDYWGDTSFHGFAPMVMERFEIIEKLHLSEALLKMAGGGVHPPHPPQDPLLALGMLLNVCLLVLRQLFLENFARAPL